MFTIVSTNTSYLITKKFQNFDYAELQALNKVKRILGLKQTEKKINKFDKQKTEISKINR